MNLTKNIISLLGFLTLLIFVFSCGTQKPKGDYLFDAKLLKPTLDTTAVKKLMNEEPDTSFYRWYYGKKRFIQMYNELADSTEFRFKKDSLIEVIVHKPTLAYEPKSIAKFGLPVKPTTGQDSAAFFMWKNVYKGFDVVNFYLTGNKPIDGKPRYKIYFKLHNGAQTSAQK